jgi:energy-coupling factor transporter transmembrane protein EcfT
MSCTTGHDTGAVGFNPYRKFVPKKTDYVFVVAAIVAVVALVAWTAFG